MHKYVNFWHRFTAAGYAYVSPRPSWLILSAISVLGHMYSIWFHFKKRNKMKWKKLDERKKKLSENYNNQIKKIKKTKKETKIKQNKET